MLPLEIHVPGASFEGFLVIDSIVNQTSSGGVRIVPDLKVDEIRDLAREMSLKYAWCRLPRGGAKAGIRLPDTLSPPARQSALEAFGRELSPIIRAGLYNPGMDLGCTASDLTAIYRGAGIELGRVTDTSFYTGMTVASAILAWAETLPESAPCTLTVEGFGSVALHLTSILPSDRFRIVAIATAAGGVAREEGFSVEELTQGRRTHGDGLVLHLAGRRMAREEVAQVAADAFLPAARTRSIGNELADALSVKAVIPIANAPYAEGVTARLLARGIDCLPGFVTNCGGVFASSLHDSGVQRNQIEYIFGDLYRRRVSRLLSVAHRRGRSPVDTASDIACRILETRQGSVPTFVQKVRARALRRGPRWLRSRTAHQNCLDSLRRLDADLAALEQR